jgi:hypothetical protein
MSAILNINTDAVVKFTNILEKIKSSALPVAIRGALNNAAFDVKTNTMPTKAKSEFVNRSPNFFKANSSFEKATGWNISQMESRVGFTSEKLQGSNNYAVKDLEQQEHGGTIGGRSFIPLKQARQGNSTNKLVKPNARLSKIKNIINAKNSRGKNQAEKFVKAAIAAGPNGYVIAGKKSILFKVTAMRAKTNLKTKESNFNFKAIPLYKYKKGGKVRVKSTGFMQNAALQSGIKIEQYFIKEAERQISKY